MSRSSSAWCVALAALATMLVLGCDEDTEVTTPGGGDDPSDTVSPLVVSVDPPMDETGVATDADITIVFSEDMSAIAAASHVTLSSGSITAATWIDARTLVIEHDGWAEGVEVTVTIGTGFTDGADNGLEASMTVRFWTQSAQVALLSTTPGDGGTEALLNQPVSMLFSEEMNIGTIYESTTVTDGTNEIPYELSDGDESWVVMTFPQGLPASSTITVNVGTGAQSMGGQNLATAVSFSFTTGDEVDEQPPSLLSIEPASGSTIAPDAGFVRFRFDEAIDTDHFSPSMVGAQFWLLADDDSNEPIWSEGNTVLTVGLPTDLPAGMPIEIRFDSIKDLAGNVQETDIVYELTVEGDANFYPMTDGRGYFYDEHTLEGDGSVTTNEFWDVEWRRFEDMGGGTYRNASYSDAAYSDLRGAEFMRLTGSAIEFTGFYDDADVYFDTPVIYAMLPWQTQSWSGSIVASGGPGLSGTFEAEVFPQEDVGFFDEGEGGSEASEMEADLVWLDCWKWVFSYDLTIGDDEVSGSWTAWFAPTVGIVKMVRVEEEAGGAWNQRELYLTGFTD